MSQIVNHNGKRWTVSHDESSLLTTIDGYLMMLKGMGLIVISTRLSRDEQARVRDALLRYLAEASTNTVGTVYWPPREIRGMKDEG